MMCDQTTRRNRPCRNRAAAGHGGSCTFHWHRRTTGPRSGWPTWYVPACCQSVNPATVTEAREAYDAGYAPGHIARVLGISVQRVNSIVLYRRNLSFGLRPVDVKERSF
jgi:transposase-like protein